MPVRARARARFALAVPLALAGLVVAGPAVAAPPQDLVGEYADLVGVVADEARVRTALADLDRTSEARLVVVYVDSFDGMDPELWADRTADLSRLGPDDLLLAVAVEDRAFQVSASVAAPLTEEQLRRVEREAIEPAVRDGDWEGAAVAAADAYADVLARRPFLMLAVLGGLALVVAGVGTAVLRRRRAEVQARPGPGGAQAQPGPEGSETAVPRRRRADARAQPGRDGVDAGTRGGGGGGS